MKNNKLKLAGGVVIIILIVSLTAIIAVRPDRSTPDNNPGLKIAATIFPLYDITLNVVGDQGEVILMLPPGASPHTFDPTPSQIRELQNTAMLFKIGYGLDDWADSTIRNASSAKIVTVDKNITLKTTTDNADEHDEGEAENAGDNEDEHGHEGPDPHYWLDLRNGAIIAQTIADELSLVDSANSEQYQMNAQRYVNELLTRHAELVEMLRNLLQRNVIVFHPGWGYLGDAYNLNVIGVIEPMPGIEPTPRYLRKLTELIEEYNVSTIFSEPQLPLDTIKPFLDDLNLTIGILDPIGGVANRNAYIELLTFNVAAISTALE